MVDLANEEYYKIYDTPVVGNVLAHALFPNNFELYFFAFELEDENQVTDRFIFPINPSQISINESKIVNVMKTSGGVVSLFNTTYNPLTINISGNFGRDFKLMTGNIEDLDKTYNSNLKDNWVNIYRNVQAFVNPFLKTGFGAFNELKRIIRKSTQLNAVGKPYKMIFYNLAFSEVYIVQILDFNPSMSNDNNTLHGFSISMRAISYYNSNSFLKAKSKRLGDRVKETINDLKTNIKSK